MIPCDLLRRGAALALLVACTACASAPLQGTGSLAATDLVRSDGLLTRSLLNVDKGAVQAARTVRILPTRFSDSIGETGMKPAQHALLANAVDRALCSTLNERLEIAGGAPADLTVRATVTHAAPTDPAAAFVSRAASLSVPLAVDIPVVVPRLPIGLGGLSVEAEALDKRGRRVAVMIWARGADAVTSAPRVSTDGDAYDLASAFGSDFGTLVTTGENPLAEPRLPSLREMSRLLGAGPSSNACRAFGPSPGLAGLIGRRIGLPPNWTDEGASSEQHATFRPRSRSGSQ